MQKHTITGYVCRPKLYLYKVWFFEVSYVKTASRVKRLAISSITFTQTGATRKTLSSSGLVEDVFRSKKVQINIDSWHH